MDTVSTDVNLYVHVMSSSCSSFDIQNIHKAVCVFQENTMIQEFLAVPKGFPEYSSNVIQGSRLRRDPV